MRGNSLFVALALLALGPGCEDKGKKSAELAKKHVAQLVETSTTDVKEVHEGLPEGAKLLERLYAGEASPEDDLKEVHEMLALARSKVQSLRVAKSNFFALATTDGKVLRNDQDQDRMAGESLFAAYPELKKARGAYIETIGSMKGAAEIAEPRRDAQWVAATPVSVDGRTRGIYATGWSLSSYASRLEFSLRGRIRSELAEGDQSDKNEPLVYVFVVVGKDVYAAPASPDVNIETIARRDVASKVNGTDVYTEALEITGRSFGLAARRAPSLGDSVAMVVLRSET